MFLYRTAILWEIRYVQLMLPGKRHNGRGQISFESHRGYLPSSFSSYRMLQQESLGECFWMKLWHYAALVCRLANRVDVLLLLHPQLLLLTHTQTQKPPVCEGTQRGLTSHFTRAGGISGANSSLSQRVDNNSMWSKWSRCMTLEFKFMRSLHHVHKETI